MKGHFLRDYILFLAPAVILPVGLYLFDNSVPGANLFKIGLLLPLVMLAMKGLSGFFPEENLKERSIGRMVEYAVLQGAVAGAFLVVVASLSDPQMPISLSSDLRRFVIVIIFVSTPNFAMALHAQKKLQAE
ncbi:hypothetical protein EPK99_11825 [Neorhizobium lilium]|uniref:Uncharacterized protein n=1 Tax=Neorhizobium lilium TaxID=2503024 RepID=A0A444LJS1_9HYPH|nr:hypothetical protein [Neorhizobium lilium]RWX79240.1 hypothetical protein EPK99_11825 [Neorhizobium lilium]